MQPIVEVQFTGNPKVYSYLLPAIYASAPVAVQPGDRCVVINKMKDDGTPSLSIATIVGVGEASDEIAKDLKPFVQLVPQSAITAAVAAQ